MTKHRLSKICCQACINEYKGEHGKEKSILSDVETFKIGHVEGHIGKFGDVAIIVFRGSDGKLDWLDNMKFWKRKVPKDWFGKVVSIHKGFSWQYQTIRDVAIITTLIHKKIIVTGHSLGGAIATQMALELKIKYPNKEIECITFGSPRVGGLKFKMLYNKILPLTLRYVYGEDTVCKVPHSFRHYAHVGNKVRLGKTSWRELLLFIPRKLFGNPLDHKPERYLREL